MSAAGPLGNRHVVIGAFEFAYLGGGVGVVVGEMITRPSSAAAARRARSSCRALAARGCRRASLSLMQMAKTSAALARLDARRGVPYTARC